MYFLFRLFSCMLIPFLLLVPVSGIAWMLGEGTDMSDIFRKKSKRVSYILILIFAAFMILQGIFSATFNYTRRQELKTFLIRKELKMVMDDSVFLDTINVNMLKRELSKVKETLSHHSSPKTRNGRKLLIKSTTDSLVINIYQDTDIENEIWIYLTKYNVQGEIGRIHSDSLIKFFPDSLTH